MKNTVIIVTVALATVLALGSVARGAAGDDDVPSSPSADAAGQNAGATDTADQGDSLPLALRPNKYETEGDWLSWPKVTGDWWGGRVALDDSGIDFNIRISQYFQSVISGGANTNSAYGGKIDYILNVDGKKLGLWDGFFVTMHTETQFGTSVLADAGAFALANTAMLYPLPNQHETAITGLLVTQALSKNIVLAAGKINIIDLWSMAYPHTGNGIDGFMNTNMISSSLPWFRWVNLSVLGGGVLVLADDGQIQGAVLAFDSQNSTTTTGFSDAFHDGTALLGMWRFFFDMGGLPGSFLVMGGASTRNYDSLAKSSWAFVPGVGLTNKTKSHTWSIGAYYDQIFWQDPDNDKRNMRFFTGWSITDGNPAFAKWGGFGSVEAWGLMPTRENDRMGVGAYFNKLSSDFKELTHVFGVDLGDMWGVELYYNAEITPWFHLTGDIQIVQNQNDTDDPAIILGLRGVLEF